MKSTRGARRRSLIIPGRHRDLREAEAVLKDHARQMATREGRSYQDLGERTRKEDLARQRAERERIQDGLICVFSVLEPCRTFSLKWRLRRLLPDRSCRPAATALAARVESAGVAVPARIARSSGNDPRAPVRGLVPEAG